MAKQRSDREAMYRAIKKNAGLSDFDSDGIEEEIDAILKALKKNGYKIVLSHGE